LLRLFVPLASSPALFAFRFASEFKVSPRKLAFRPQSGPPRSNLGLPGRSQSSQVGNRAPGSTVSRAREIDRSSLGDNQSREINQSSLEKRPQRGRKKSGPPKSHVGLPGRIQGSRVDGESSSGDEQVEPGRSSSRARGRGHKVAGISGPPKSTVSRAWGRGHNVAGICRTRFCRALNVG
jgi:hypothetical protein